MKLFSLFSSLRALRVFAAAILFSVASSASAQIVLTLTPTDTTKVYGDAEPETWYTDKGNRRTATGFGFTLTGNFADGDDEDEVLRTADRHRILVREAGDDVGSYAFSLASDFTGWTALGGSTPVPNIQRGVIKGKFFRDDFATTPKYRVVLAQNAAFTITKKEVTYTSTAADKVYDGTTAAPASLGGSFAADDLEDGDTVTATGGTYASDQVGEGIAITGFAVSGDDAANYSLASGSSVAGDITAKSLTLSGVKLTKAEGGGTATTGATVAATIEGLVSGHTGSLALVDSPTAVFASADAGDNIAVTGLTGAQLVLTVKDSGNNDVASNYQLPDAITATGQITSVAITPPAAPGAPTLTPNFRSIEVSWTAPADNGNAITDNRVRWRTAAASGNPAGDWNGAGNNGVLTGTATSYTITGLTNGTQYDVQVAAVNGGGAGAFSPSASAAPVANLATLAALVFTGSDNNAITLSPVFDAATEGYTATVAAGVATVTVTATASDADAGTLQLVRTVSGTPGAAQTLTGGTASSPQALIRGETTLAVTVTSGDSSATKTYTVVLTRPNDVPGAPDAPTLATGTAAGSLNVSWSAPSDNGGSAVTGYKVRWGRDAASVAWNANDGVDTDSDSAHAITGLNTGTAYQVQVAAVNAQGTGAWSASATATPQAAQDNADISALAANGADGVTTFVLTPEFSAATTSYAATVGNEVEGVIFTATFAGTKLVIGDDDDDNSPASGAAGDVVSLSPGVAKDITLVVTAADGSTTKTYTVTVTRAAGVPRKPGAPGLGIGEFTSNPGDINIRWDWAGGADNNGAAHTGYRYQWRAKGVSAWEPDAMGTWVAQTGAISRSINIGGLQVGALYQVRWRIVNSVGDGPWSDVAESRTSGPPRATATFDAVPGHGKISISNIANSGSDFGGGTIPAPGFTRTLALSGRDIRWRTSRRGGNPPGDWQNAAGASDEGQDIVLAASYEITGLNGNRSYDVQMRLYNKFSGADGKGDWSRTQKVTPTKTPLTITPLAASKVYGAADPALTYTIAGAVDGDGNSEVFSASPINRGAGENAGEYDFSLKSSIPWASAGNPEGKYTIVTALDGDAKFTINQKEVTYTSTGADKVYDSKQDAPAALGGSFAAGDIVVASGLGINDTGKLLVTGGRYGDKNVGTAKTVTQFVLDGDSKDNYSLASGSSVAGDITKLATTLTLSADARVYDGSSDIAAVRTAFSPAIFSGDTVTVDTSGAAYGDANVGASKTITGVADAQISGADKGNYEITIAGTGEVTQRPLRVTASGEGTSRPGSSALSGFLRVQSGVSGEGLVGSDTAATVLTGAIVIEDEVGTTSALTQGNLGATGNYRLIWTDGVFTRTALPVLTVTPEHTTRVFGGTDPTFTVTVALSSGSYASGDDANTKFFTDGAAVLLRESGDDVGVYAFSLVNPLPLQDSGDSARYTIVVAAGADYRITPKELRATAIVVEKTYDATNAITGATLSGGVLSGLESSDAATLAIQSGSDAVYATTDVATGITMTNMDSADFEISATTGSASNYAVPASLSITGAITAKEVTVAAVTLTKEYDGDTAFGASAVKTGTGEVTGTAGGESLVVTASAGVYDAAGAGARTISGETLALASGDGSAKPANYELPSSVTVNGEITAKEVTVADVTATKTFDNTNSMTGAVLSGGAVTGAIGSQTFTLRLAVANDGVFASVNAGARVGVTGADFELAAFPGDSASDPANYSLPEVTVIGVIEPKELTISGAATLRKFYDGTNTAPATGTNAVVVTGGDVQGAVGTNTFRLVLAAGHDITYSQSDVGAALTFAGADAADFELQGAGDGDPANYALPGEITALGEITQREVTVDAVTLTKTYDGTAVVVAGVTIGGGDLGNLVDGELLELQAVTGLGAFPQSDVGEDLRVSGVQFSLADGAGGKASNYQLPSGGVDVFGVIEAKEVTVSDPELQKEFDATPLFGETELVEGTGVITGTVGDDALVLVPITGVYGSATVSSGLKVSSITWELRTAPDGSGDPANYSLPASVPDTLEDGGAIIRKLLTLSQGDTVPTKVYDGTVAPPPGLNADITVVGLVEDANNVQITGGDYNSKNVLSARFLTVTIAGADAGNYRLDENVKGVPATITPKTIGITGTLVAAGGNSKVYDGNTDAPAGFSLSGGTINTDDVIEADRTDVAIGTGGTYNSKNVDDASTIAPELTGAEAGNYQITETVTGTITERPLRVTADNVAALTRPDAADLTFSIASGVAGEGLVVGESAGDVLTGVLAFGTANADNTVPIVVGTLAVVGGNYNLEFTDGLFYPSGPLDLDVSGTATFEEGAFIMRYLFGLRGDALTAGLSTLSGANLAALGQRVDALIAAGTLDVDGNAGTTARDGVIIARYLLGVTEAASLVAKFGDEANADNALAAVRALLPTP